MNSSAPQLERIRSTALFDSFFVAGKEANLDGIKFSLFKFAVSKSLVGSVPANKKKSFLDNDVKMDNVKAIVHPAFHGDNFANLTPAEAENPLYEHAGNLVLWVSPVIGADSVASLGFPYILARGAISRVGTLNGRLTSERAAIPLSLMHTVAVDRSIYAGRMRVSMAGTVNNHEEKAWDKELRLWWDANKTTAAQGIPSTVSTPAKTTNAPDKLWAEYLSTRDMPTLLPGASEGVSSEAGWNAFIDRTNDAKEMVRTWVGTWHDSDIDNEHACSCGEVLVGAELVFVHYHTDGPLKCTRKAREDLGLVKQAIHKHDERRHRQLMESRASMVIMLKPQAVVA